MIYAGTKGYLDKLPVADVGRLEAGLLTPPAQPSTPDVLDMITTQDPKIARRRSRQADPRRARRATPRDFA